MTYFEAALRILRASKRPLTTSEILDRIVRQGLIQPTGKTPEATLAATLYRHLPMDDELARVAEFGRHRAVRGSVRWATNGP